MKFGKVSMEEVSMKYYEPDTTVDAAVLCEYGELDPVSLNFTWMIRYKVFTREGLNHLIMSIPADSKSLIKGVVFNLEEGKIVKSKLENSSIYKERLFESYTRMRVAPPNAREGSVVDLQFIMRGVPWEWNFQKKIPVLWSELRIPFSEKLKMDENFIGHEPLYISSNSRWVARDMPAFQSEPFVNSDKNYMTRMFLEVTERTLSYGPYRYIYRTFIDDWDAVADAYYRSPMFGGLHRAQAPFFTDLAKVIMSTHDTDAARVTSALSYIRSQVKWNKKKRLWADPEYTLRGVYMNNRIGNSADMNFLFMQLIQKMGIECYPTIMSVREEGIINPIYPSISKFNYTISYVKVGDRFFLIDAADKYYPLDMLNADCLNIGAFVIRSEGGEWVDIVPEQEDKEMINCVMQINEDGIIRGNVTVQYAGYASASIRKEKEKYTTEDEYLEMMEKEYHGILIEDYKIENLEKFVGPVKEEFSIEFVENASTSGELIHLDPVFIGRIEENPFKLETRKYPVDFACGKSKMYIMTLNLPEGYEAEQLPKPIKLVNTDKSATFQYSAVQSGNTIQVMYRLILNKPRFMQDEYEELRSFYTHVFNKQHESIILRNPGN